LPTAKRTSQPASRPFVVKLTFECHSGLDDGRTMKSELVAVVHLPASKKPQVSKVMQALRRIVAARRKQDKLPEIVGELSLAWLVELPENEGLLWEEHQRVGGYQLGRGYTDDESEP
jgi:hypothetical protein